MNKTIWFQYVNPFGLPFKYLFEQKKGIQPDSRYTIILRSKG